MLSYTFNPAFAGYEVMFPEYGVVHYIRDVQVMGLTTQCTSSVPEVQCTHG